MFLAIIGAIWYCISNPATLIGLGTFQVGSITGLGFALAILIFGVPIAIILIIGGVSAITGSGISLQVSVQFQILNMRLVWTLWITAALLVQLLRSCLYFLVQQVHLQVLLT